MPQASCDICIQSIYGTDIQICRCDAVASENNCTHWQRHHAEVYGLCVSARNGCRMCSELWRFFFKEKTPDQYLASAGPGELPGQGFIIGHFVHVFQGSGTSFRVTEVADEVQSGDGLLLALDFGINSPMIYEVENRRYLLKKSSDYEIRLALFMNGLLNTDDGSSGDSRDLSKKRWDWVRVWMAECADKDRHKLCSRALDAIESSSYLPTRVIEVASVIDQDNRRHYKLLQTAKFSPGSHRYATLSHTWGAVQQPPYRTVSGNYEERLQHGIPRDSLPACFQDAIDVAEKLDIPYIWIDSLCIIQDDDIDCPTEAGRMDQVYSNSFLNLSATASSSSKDRLPSVAKMDRLQEPRFVGTVWSGRYAGNYQIFDPNFWPDRVESSRLASRGWIFQERALAPRVLHFGFDQVLWECAESQRAEEFPHGIPLRSTATGREGLKWYLNVDPFQDTSATSGDATVLQGSVPSQYAVLDRKWSAVIDAYSRCELTKASDKLVAVSGVAKVLADRFNDTYIAGLWQSNLIGGLCWRVPKMRRTTQDLIPSGLYARRWEISRRLEGNGAPSWSWASVDGEVDTGPFQTQDREHSMSSDLESDVDGYTSCTSRLLSPPKVQVISKTQNNSFGEVDTERTRLHLHGTTYPLEVCPPDLGRGLTFRHPGTENLMTVFLDQPEELSAVEGAQFLPLVQMKRHVVMSGADAKSAEHEHSLDHVIGIIVVPIGGTDAYRRIGLHECQASRLDCVSSTVQVLCLK